MHEPNLSRANRYFKLLYHSAGRVLGSMDRAADAATATIVDAVNEGMDSPGQKDNDLRNWLVERCRVHTETLKQRHGALGPRGNFGPRMSMATTEIDRFRQELFENLEELPWLVITFKYVEALDPVEAAALLGLGVPAYERMLERHVGDLRSQFRRYEGMGDEGFDPAGEHPLELALRDGGFNFAVTDRALTKHTSDLKTSRKQIASLRTQVKVKTSTAGAGGGSGQRRLVVMAAVGVVLIAGAFLAFQFLVPKPRPMAKRPPPPPTASMQLALLKDGKPAPLTDRVRAGDVLKLSYSNQDLTGYKFLAFAGLDRTKTITWFLPQTGVGAKHPGGMPLEEGVEKVEVAEVTIPRLPLSVLELCAFFSPTAFQLPKITETFKAKNRWPAELHRHCLEVDVVP